MHSDLDRRLASGTAVAALVLLVAGLVAVVSHAPATAVAAPAPAPAHDDGTHAEGGTHVDMATLQDLVQSAYCAPAGSEVAGGTPDTTLTVPVGVGAYGDGPLTVTAGELVRVRVANADSVAHELGVFHESRPGCALVLATAAPGEVVEVDLRLAAGTYVYGDRTHPGERDLLTVVQSAEAARP